MIDHHEQIGRAVARATAIGHENEDQTAKEVVNSYVKQAIHEAVQTDRAKRKEFVICAAVRMPDGYIVHGHRHSDAIRTARQIPRYEDIKPSYVPPDNQGFITSWNRYVTRAEAYNLQRLAGIESIIDTPRLRYLGGECYSEDLY